MTGKRNSSSWLLALLPMSLLCACQYIDGPHGGRQDSWWYCDESRWDYEYGGCYLCTENGCYRCSNPWGSCREGSFCFANSDCPEGSICDTDRSVCEPVPPPCSKGSDCPSSQICQNGSCVPAPSPCDGDQACGAGAYCSNGTCKNGGLCSGDPDCAALGDFVCDERGSCVPVPPPAACLTGGTCPDGLCLDGKCGTCAGNCGGGTTCQFNNHCGDGRVCLNGQCTSSCTSPADCGSGQTCKSSVCVPDTAGFCLSNASCTGGKVCLNNFCFPSCSGACLSAKDVCTAPITVGSQQVQVCTPDQTAHPQCTLNKDCQGGEQCVNGICRTTCLTSDDCKACPAGPVCGKGGFCMTAIENAPECATNADCSGKACLNGQCTTL